MPPSGSAVLQPVMTVRVATRHYAPEPTGSAPVIQELAEWLARSGCAVEVVTVRPSYPEPRILPGYDRGERDDMVENGVRVRRWPTRAVTKSAILARVGPEARFMIDLAVGALVGRFRKTDALISLCPSILTVLGGLVVARGSTRHVAVVHDITSGLGAALGLNAGGPVMRLLRGLERFSLNRVDHVVALSTEMEGALRRIGVTTPILVVPPHIDTRAIRPLPRPDGAPPTLMYSGNLGRKQGLDQIVDLAALLRTEAPDVRVLVRGDGAMRGPMLERARTEGLSNLVIEGLVPKDEVPRSLAEGDVHLVPQLPDGQAFAVPSKAFAIMAAGRPFVATAAAGTPLAELADGVSAGICTPPGDVAAFARAALALLRDPETRAHMGRAGRAHAERTADTDIVMGQIMAVLRPVPALLARRVPA